MKKFCDYCLQDVDCNYCEKETEIEIRNKKIKYLKKYYICSKCNHEFLDDLYDYDIETVNNKLREENNIITTSEIEELIEKYGIGKKPLSLILGLGEINIIRYLNGSNPTREISNLLKAILNNPFIYEMYLTVNKDKISESTYKKSLGKTKQLELLNSKSKIYNIALYIINKLESADALVIQKILYFIYGFSNKFLNNNIFNDLPQAWVYGPVYKEIYESFSYYKGDSISYEEILNNRNYDLNEKEKEYIDTILKNFGCYSGLTLKNMTHLTAPWINARKGLEENAPSQRIIEEKDINEYFNKICEKYNIIEMKDINKYSKDLFKQAQKHFLK